MEEALAREILKDNQVEIDPSDPASLSAIVKRLGLVVTGEEASAAAAQEIPQE